MSWDKIGNPANVKACGKCCGLDTGYQDPDPCTPYRSGIYPNAGVKVYLSVEWTPFGVTTAGYFDRATLKAHAFSNLEGEVTDDGSGPGDNGGIPTNLTVVNEAIAIDPFAIELTIFPEGLEGFTTNQNECYYMTPDLLSQIRSGPNAIGPSEVNVGGTLVGVSGVNSISQWNLRYQDAGYLRVQGPAFADRTTANGRTFSNRLTYDDVFGDVVASATLTLIGDVPLFNLRLIQLRETTVTDQPVDSNGNDDGPATVSTGYNADLIFQLQSYSSSTAPGASTPQYTKHFNCSDFPVFLGDDVFTWISNNTIGRTFGEGEPYDLHGVPFSQAPGVGAGDGNRPIDDPVTPVWPAGYVTSHPQWNKPGSPVFIMNAGRNSVGSRDVPMTTDEFGFPIPGPVGAAVTETGSAIRRINTLGLQDLTVRLFSDPGDIA